MFPVEIQLIIAKYVSPDIFVRDTVRLGWNHDMFFRMRLLCLPDIVKELSIDITQMISNPYYYIGDNPNFDVSFADIIYRLIYDIDRDDEHTHTISCFLSRCTPLSTSEYIQRYPKAVSFPALCLNKYIDLKYLLKNHSNDINWENIASNDSIPLQCLTDYKQHINLQWICCRSESLFEEYMRNELNGITYDMTFSTKFTMALINSNIPVDLIMRKYRHRITSRLTFERLLKHPNTPIEYLLNNCISEIKNNYSIYVTRLPSNDHGRWCLSKTICEHPNLPFNILFRDHLDIIDWSSLCKNPNLPFDILFRNFEHNIVWDSLCQNINFPVRLLNHAEYRQKCKSIHYNVYIDFSKINNDVLSEMHDKLIDSNNSGYYTYLIEKDILGILNVI